MAEQTGTKRVFIRQAGIARADVAVAGESFIYTGSPITPAVSVTLKNTQLVEGRDYTLAYTCLLYTSGEWRLVAGVIHRQIKGSPLANVQTDEAWCFGGGAGLKGIFQKVSQKRTELRLRNNRLLLHLNHSLQIGFLEEGLLCIVVQNLSLIHI